MPACCHNINNILYPPPLTATISCPPLEHPANGLVTLEENSPGSVATYSCDEDHSLLGSATSLCQSNGAWSNQPPTCAKSTFSQFLCGSNLSLFPCSRISVERAVSCQW